MRKPAVMRFGSSGTHSGLATDGKAEIKTHIYSSDGVT